MNNILKKIISYGIFSMLLFFFVTSAAQTLSIPSLERIASVKNPKEYLIGKELTVKNDSSKGENINLKLLNRSTQEILYLKLQRTNETDTLLEVDYFLKNKDDYARVVRQVVKQGYAPINDEKHYEKRSDNNFQIHQLTLKGYVSLKGWDYYCINYSYQGKWQETPAAKDTKKK